MKDLKTEQSTVLLSKDYESILSALAIASEGASEEQRKIYNDVADKIVLHLEKVDQFTKGLNKIRLVHLGSEGSDVDE